MYYKISKLEDNKYHFELNENNNLEIISKLFELNSINFKKVYNILELNNINNITSFSDFKNNYKFPYFDYDKIFNWLRDLTEQLNYLESNKKYISYVSNNDFLIVNDKLILINNEKILDINNNSIKISKPYNKKEEYLPIEYEKNNELPLITNYLTGNYSIAKFLINNLLKQNGELKKTIRQIYGTPLYYILINCLHENPENRYLIIL